MLDTHVAAGDSSARPIDLATVRHPAEPSRLAMAVVCVSCALIVVVVWAAVINLLALIYSVLGLVLVLLLIWLLVQLSRLRLLGDAVLVSAETFPEVQSAVDEVRAMLQYEHRVDIFVVPNLSPRIQQSSYFGVRALLFEGGAIADITAPATRPQLLFLLGTYFGAFKAKHDRWPITEVVLDSAGVRKILAPLVTPWLRATVYTGDQIAYVCSRDFRVSVAAVCRVLVGRELTSQLAVPGLILQAARVSGSPVLRLSELFRPDPHGTNRFLNLVRFAQQVDPESVLAFRAELPEEINRVLDEALARMERRGRRTFGAAAVTVGVVVVSAILVYLGYANVGWQATLAGSQSVPAAPPVSEPETQVLPEEPTVEESENPSAELIECWDGSVSDVELGCPGLTGESALQWVFLVGGASCITDDPAEYNPAGAVTVMICSWSDLPGTDVYLTEWTTPGETRWDEYYVANAAAVEKGEWSLEQGVSGTAWNGALYDVNDTLIALDNVQAYSVAPFAVEYYSDVARGGGIDAMAEAQRRMSFRIPDAIAEAEAMAG